MDFRILIVAGAVAISCLAAALAQTVNITGTLTDPSGATQTFSIPVIAQGTNPATVTIGETAIGPSADNGNGNLILVTQAMLVQQGTIQTMSMYITNVAGFLQLGIYDATGPNGGPGNKVAMTPAFTPVVGWNTANVQVPVLLNSGTYWLAYLPSDGGLAFTKDAGGSAAVSYGINYTFNGDMPSPFGTPTGMWNTDWSVYATLQVGSVPDYTVEVTVNPPLGGTVTGGGTFAVGSQNTVVATSAAGFAFQNWTEASSGSTVLATTPSYTFLSNAVIDFMLIANFVPVVQGNFTVNLGVNPPGAGTVTGAGTYPAGTNVTVTATPN